MSISKGGELAVRLNTRYYGGYARTGTLARVPLSGGTPREVLDNVQDADWSANGDSMAVVRYIPENNHWRLEYPIGKVLYDSINWISHPKISADGKWIAFADHENPGGDDEGSVPVAGAVEELLALLRQGLRQHSIASQKRTDYVLRFLRQHPP